MNIEQLAWPLVALVAIIVLAIKGPALGPPLGKMAAFLGKANSEDNGNPSSMRLTTFMVTTQFSAVLTFGFGWVVVTHPELVLAYAGLLLSVILGVLGIKKWQKDSEEKVVTPPGASDAKSS